jgi:hypothetical protein
MSYTVLDPTVGQLVYKSFSPVQAGKIVEIVRSEVYGSFEVRVKWIGDGSESVVSTRGLRDFRKLIEDHERKLETHRKMLERLEEL